MTQLAWDTYMGTQAADTAQRDTGVVQDTGYRIQERYRIQDYFIGAGDAAGPCRQDTYKEY